MDASSLSFLVASFKCEQRREKQDEEEEGGAGAGGGERAEETNFNLFSDYLFFTLFHLRNNLHAHTPRMEIQLVRIMCRHNLT